MSVAVTVIAHDVGGVGGMERHLSELVTGLAKRGFRVTIIARTCRLPPDAGVRFIRVPGPSRPFPVAYVWFAIAASAVTMTQRRNVVHATGAIIGNRVDVSTVHLLHHAICELGISRSARNTRLYRLNARIGERMSLIAERYCFRPKRTGRLVAVSDGVRREIARHFPAMRSAVHVVPNGVDVDRMRGDPERRLRARARWKLAPDELVALFIGGDWERKGLFIAINAVAAAAGWVLVVAGAGLESAAEVAARRAGLGSRLRLLGRVDPIEEQYPGGDVFVLPSAYETFSLATYEAAACGLPLLVTRVSGVEDILRDGVNGWFITREPASIEPKLDILRRDRALRLQMGDKARAAVLDHTWSAMVERHADVYRRIAQGKRAKVHRCNEASSAF